MTDGHTHSTIRDAISEPRFAPYLREARGDEAAALELYKWSARMSSAAFELIAHAEVFMRNAMDAALARKYQDVDCGIPWLLREPLSTPRRCDASWRSATVYVPAISSHDTRSSQVCRLVSGPACSAPSTRRSGDFRSITPSPATTTDTVVVAARHAWPLYGQERAYVCQAGRWFRPVTRLAFYTDQEIKADVPLIRHRRDNVPWNDDHAVALSAGGREDRKIAAVIRASRRLGWTVGMYQVFLLTHPGDPDHRVLPRVIPHHTSGRGSAFTQRQRYVSLHALETATTTDDLT